MKRTLFQERTSYIWITIELYTTEKEQLVIHGHDLGQVVDKIKGRYDYEYYLTIEKEEVQELIKKLEVSTIAELFTFFSINYSTDKAFSQITKKLEELHIKHQFSSW